MAQTSIEIASALFKAIETKDAEGVASLYHDEIEIWHNFTNACMNKAQNVATLAELINNVDVIEYAVIERLDLGDRIMQRHTLRCTLADGYTVEVPACIFVTINNGKITRIDEYLDTRQANELRTKTGRTSL